MSTADALKAAFAMGREALAATGADPTQARAFMDQLAAEFRDAGVSEYMLGALTFNALREKWEPFEPWLILAIMAFVESER